MAEKIKIYELDIDEDKLIQKQGTLIKQIDELKKSNADLKKSAGGINKLNKEQAEQYAKTELQLKQLNAEYRTNQKVVTDANKSGQQNLSFTQKLTKAYTAAALQVVAVIAAVKGLIDGVQTYIKNAKELQKQQRIVSTLFGVSRNEAKGLTSEIRALSKTFEVEFNDVTKSANILMKEFGITGNEALSLIEDGFRKGANVNGEFLEQLKEYPGQLKAVGLDASQTIAIITQTEREGIFSDKGIDAIKEAGIRIRELTPATTAALDGIGLSSKEIELALRTNSISMFDVIQMVSKQLQKLPENSIEVGTAIADIFGGAGEDAGLRFLKTLGDINTDLNTLDSTLTESQEQQLRLNKSWEEFRTLVFSGSSDINKAIASILGLVANILDGFVNLKKEGSIFLALFEVIKGAVILNFKGIYTALKIFFLEPFIGAVDVVKAAWNNLFGDGSQSLSGAFTNFLENQKNNFTSFKDTVVDIGKDIAEAYNGINEEVAEATKARNEDEEVSAEANVQRRVLDANKIKDVQLSNIEAVGVKDQEMTKAENKRSKESLDLYRQIQDQKLQASADLAGSLADIAGRQSAFGKGLAIAQATINTYQGATQALASLPPPASFIAAAATIAQGLVQVRNITGIGIPKFAKGGLQEVGGKAHSAGGTKFWGEDGTAFEAEKGELIGVMNKSAAKNFMLLNKMGGGSKIFSDPRIVDAINANTKAVKSKPVPRTNINITDRYSQINHETYLS